MNKKVITLSVAVFVLLSTNIMTVLIYNYRLADLRNQSSFTSVSNLNESFRACLDRNNIENKIINDKIAIREVDRNQAIAACS